VGITVDEAIDRAGGWGRFQTFLLVNVILAMNSAGLVVYGVFYLELQPEYINCVMKDGEVLKDLDGGCTFEAVCTDDNVVKYDINYDSKYTLINWMFQLDLFCQPVGLIGAYAFLGAALSCLFLPALGDKYGRYPVFQTTMAF